MTTGSQPNDQTLDLREGISLLEAASEAQVVTRPDGSKIELGHDWQGNPSPGGVFDSQKRVPIHVIRPGIGKGRGRHLYEPGMLKENAAHFAGWKSYLNHLSPEAKKAAGGLPRDVRDLGGRLTETWWDPTVPADPAKGHGQGAVVGMMRPVKAIRELIDDDPELIEASISASATGVRPVTRDGQRVWLVEGINPRGSVDWVTEAGAGGKVAAILNEAYAEDDDVTMALLESMSDSDLLDHLRRDRPDLLTEAAEPGEPNSERTALSENNPEGGDVAEITPEALSEALSASPDILLKALQTNGEAQVFLSSLVESKMADERDAIRAEARADVDRAFQLAALERVAHEQIRESKLPDSWQAGLREKFSLTENKPTDALDVVDDVDESGKVTKPAKDKLAESVKAEIEREQTRLREASGTRVRTTAATPAQLAEAAKGGEEDRAPKGEKSYWKQILSEANVPDPEKAYAPIEG